MPWQSTRGNGARRFLESHFLIVPIHGLAANKCQRRGPCQGWRCSNLRRVDRERTLALAISTVADLDLFRSVLVEGPENGTAFDAVKLDILELGENAGSPGDNARDSNELVQI